MIVKNQALLTMALLATATVCATPEVKKEVKPVVKDELKVLDTGKKASTSTIIKDINTNITVGDVIKTGQATIDLNVRYVNTMEAMQTCKKGTEKTAELEKKRQSLTEEIKKHEQKITQAMNDFKSKEAMMSSSARSMAEANIVKMRGEYENIVKASEAEMKIAMQEATEVLAADVEKGIIELAKKENLDIVTDTFTGRTIYASKKALLTDELVKNMDKGYSAPAKSAPTKTATA